MLGQFGADGDFQSESEEWFVIIVMMTGGIALLLSSLAVGYEVRKDMRAEEAEMKVRTAVHDERTSIIRGKATR